MTTGISGCCILRSALGGEVDVDGDLAFAGEFGEDGGLFFQRECLVQEDHGAASQVVADAACCCGFTQIRQSDMNRCHGVCPPMKVESNGAVISAP